MSPLYLYRCPRCGGIEQKMKTMSKMEQPEYCGAESCKSGEMMHRLIGGAHAHVHAGTPRFHQRSSK